MTAPSPADEAILDLVARIPPGRLACYGDVATAAVALGFRSSARRVAAVLRDYGSGVPWWRVVRASGELAPTVSDRAEVRLREEGVAVVVGRVDLAALRWRW